MINSGRGDASKLEKNEQTENNFYKIRGPVWRFVKKLSTTIQFRKTKKQKCHQLFLLLKVSAPFKI